MTKFVLAAVLTATGAGMITMIVLAATMMPSMMDGHHMGMMGEGSDPSDEEAVAGASDVAAANFAFSPANIVVEAGTTVTWTNGDPVGHTVTSDQGDALNSPLFNQDETFTFTFTEPGEYWYHCAPHPNMKGLVTVTARPAG